MKKIFIAGFAIIFSFGIFAQSVEKNEQQEDKDVRDALDYMDENGIEYVLYDESEVTVLPKGASLLNIEFVQSFIGNINLTETVLMESYVYADFNNPNGRRLELAGGVDASGYSGYQLKWQKYSEMYNAWGNMTKNRFCPGGSGENLVDFCTQTNGNVSTMLADYNEYTACNQCDNDEIVRFRYGVNLYSTSFIRYWNGNMYIYLPVTVYAGWQYSVSDGTPQPYSPSSDICETPVYLVTLCPEI